MTARSWKISTDTERMPCGVDTSPLSISILEMTAVDDIATTEPNSSASCQVVSSR